MIFRHVCSECKEPAIPSPPRTLVPYDAHGTDTPRWSHLDGQPLCPVVGSNGYEPAQPVMLANRSLDETRGCSMRWPCEACGSQVNAIEEVSTVETRLGVFCLSLCFMCVDAGRVDSAMHLSAVDVTERVAEHCEHLGMTVDEMAALLAAEHDR